MHNPRSRGTQASRSPPTSRRRYLECAAGYWIGSVASLRRSALVMAEVRLECILPTLKSPLSVDNHQVSSCFGACPLSSYLIAVEVVVRILALFSFLQLYCSTPGTIITRVPGRFLLHRCHDVMRCAFVDCPLLGAVRASPSIYY